MEASDRYRIGRRIGGGGMAEVFEADALGQHGFSRKVALKRLRTEGLDQASVRSFIDEATIASRLHHNNIVAVLDFGLSDGRPFIVMELVDGFDLAALQDASRPRQLRAPVEAVLHIGIEVCRALEYAHRAQDGGRPLGIVHRDVSPENILVSHGGEVKLADFGIAFAHERLEATRVGVVKGKLEYLAPEQLRMAEVDGRADVFSLGIVLHRLLTGENPMADSEIRQRVIAGENPPISNALPEDIRSALERATRSSPRQRFASAAELGQQLFAAFNARTKKDGPTLLANWVSTVRQAPRVEASSPNVFDALLNVELVLAPDSNSVRSFTSIESRPHEIAVAEPTVISPTAPRATAEDAATVMVETKRRARTPETIEPPGADPLLGLEVHGYKLERLIGQGASSRVYQAVHSVLDREVAIKVLSGPHAYEERSFERLRREAKALLRSGHPNVVAVIDFGKTPLGQPFLATELLRGRTLRERVAAEGALSPEQASELLHQMAAGLVAAHNAGVIHRDLKPSNVFLVPGRGGEVVKLLDFGVARLNLGEPDLTRLTKPDRLLGTPRFMAPEQIRGASEVGPAADLYSLGSVAFLMLTGRPAFEGNSSEVVHKQLTEPPPKLPDCRGLERLVTRLLEKDPKDRPASAEAVLEELVRLGFPPPKSAPDPITVASSTITQERTTPRRTNPALRPLSGLPLRAQLIVAASMAIATLSLLLLFILGRSPEPVAVAPSPSKSAAPITAVPGVVPKMKQEGPEETVERAPPHQIEPDEPEASRNPRPPRKNGRTADDTQAFDRLRRRLIRSLATHGLAEARIEREAFTKDAYQRWQRALRAKDLAQAEAELATLELLLPNLDVDEGRLNQRLRKLAAELQELPKASLGNLEDRYLEVRSGLRPRMKTDDLRALALRIAALERDVRRARRSESSG